MTRHYSLSFVIATDVQEGEEGEKSIYLENHGRAVTYLRSCKLNHNYWLKQLGHLIQR